MLKLQNCSTVWNINDFNGLTDIIPNLQRPKKRIVELMLKSAQDTTPTSAPNQFLPIFYRSPLELMGDDQVKKVKVCVNTLEGDDILKQQSVATNQTETLECDLAITSIGYKSIQVDSDIPFNSKKGVAVNANGQISDGLFTSGWLATGPTGVILTTMSNAFTTADLICKELESARIDKPGYDYILKLLNNRNVQTVDWGGWKKIDEYEKNEGAKSGKPREKVLDIREMLEIAN